MLQNFASNHGVECQFAAILKQADIAELDPLADSFRFPAEHFICKGDSLCIDVNSDNTKPFPTQQNRDNTLACPDIKNRRARNL